MLNPAKADVARCRYCGAALCADEIALTKKLVDRTATEFACLDCLAAFFGCSAERLRQKIEQFRRNGCRLFTDEN